VGRQWYRLETPDAPQGHALARDWGESTFASYEQGDGSWVVWRIDTNSGYETPKAQVPEFADVRTSVDTAIQTYEQGRTANPRNPFSYERYLHPGVGALIGTVAGMLLGGLPGMLVNHGAVTMVGMQAGGVVGAALGAVAGESSRQHKEAERRAIQGLKSKLLR
jgi:predicted lipid-binding transport protein (Tim44 family)